MLSGIRLKRKATPLAEKFSAAGNPIRMAILCILKEEPTEAGDIVDRLNLPAALVSHHLKILLSAGLVTKTTYGKLVTYYLKKEVLEEMGKFIVS